MIDTHCHPYLPPADVESDAVLDRARAAGVTAFVVPAYDPASWSAVEKLAADHSDVHPAYGLHPWVAEEPLDLAELENLLRGPGVVAAGEIGLDFKLDSPDRNRQIAVFRDQLALARDLDLPVVLHNRGAFEEMADILAADGPVRGVLHAFSRGPELAERFVGLGLHLGFGGAVTRPTARRPRRSVVTAPADRILLETDAPSIGLDGVPAGQSEPRHVVQVAEAVAELRGSTVADIIDLSTRNALALFGLS